MKYIKIIVLVILLFLGFALENEIYMNELWNFDCAYFRVTQYDYFADDNERSEFIGCVAECADKYDLGVFTVRISIIDNYSYRMDFFGNEKAVENINRYFEIDEKTYNSLVSGKTEVVFHGFLDLAEYDNRYVSSVSFIGEDENIDKLYNEVISDYEISYPKVIGGSDKDVIYIVWSMIASIMFTLTVFEVIYRKKEITLRLSFGENVWAIIGKSILKEMVIDCAVYFFVHKIVFSIISGEFMAKDTFMILIIGGVVSSLLYFDYAVYDMKKVFSNVKNSETFLGINYFIKICITCITIFSISTSIEMVNDNYIAADDNSIISRYGDYSFVKVRNLIPVKMETLEERDKQFFEIYNSIFVDYFESSDPIICSVMLEDDFRNISYVVANKNAENIVADFLESAGVDTDTYAEVVYILPDFLNSEFDLSLAEECLASMVSEAEELTSQKIYYSAGSNFTCIERDSTYGIRTVEDPVIIWFRDDSKCEDDRFLDPGLINDTIFYLTEDDYENILCRYQIEENGFELSMTTVSKSYEIKNSIFRRTVQFCSSLSVFFMILQTVLLISVNALEYQLNAVELALKKIYGYGTVRKNIRQIILGPVMDIVFGGVVWLICEVFKLLRTNVCIQLGIGIAFIELIVMLINIALSEKRSTVKTLKGGCL